MSSEPSEETHVRSEPGHGLGSIPCDGTSLLARWDEPAALRGELLPGAHLAAHAADIARAHGEPSREATAGPLRARFAEARLVIRDAYATLAKQRRKNHDPSPAEEWLLDNSHVVEEQLREVEEDLPAGYLTLLPRIARGTMAGYPRVYGLCIDYLRHTDARIELESLASYVLAYQSVSPLAIGELWAVPLAGGPPQIVCAGERTVDPLLCHAAQRAADLYIGV